MLSIEGLTKEYDTGKEIVVAVKDVSLTVKEGETCVLIGSSGCGKTTLLKLINRLIEPSAGHIRIKDKDTRAMNAYELRRRIGYVIQEIGLFPNMTIEENISVVPKLLRWNKKQCGERVRELLEVVSLPTNRSFCRRYPFELSGGQKQRVGVARALAGKPDLLLMDEPFGAIDPINRTIVQDEFLQIQRTLGVTVIFVSHDIDEAIKMGSKLAVLAHGKLIQHATPAKILEEPANDYVRKFIGRGRVMKKLHLFTVSQAMREGKQIKKSPPHTISVSNSLFDAMNKLYECHTEELLCINKEREPVGIIDHDRIKNFLLFQR